MDRWRTRWNLETRVWDAIGHGILSNPEMAWILRGIPAGPGVLTKVTRVTRTRQSLLVESCIILVVST